jgi:hypothetical protein
MQEVWGSREVQQLWPCEASYICSAGCLPVLAKLVSADFAGPVSCKKARFFSPLTLA